MDNASDDKITFDDEGHCNYCNNALSKIGKVYFPNEEGKKRLDEMLATIKADGSGKKYDCMMGISGGLDSSYLAYLGYTWGLRILAVHVDDGFDTAISQNNIKKLVAAAHIDLVTIKPDAKQFNNLTKAYMIAGVPNLAVPQDNILFAALYKYARENNLKYFLSGGNFALECILQRGNTHAAYDLVNIKDIHRRFGTEPIDKLPFISQYRVEINKRILGLRTILPLNYIDYNRDSAFKELNEFCGFEYYGRKHLENILTAFVQLVWFPKKFGVDKRTSHLSSMIVSGQMTRGEALIELSKPLIEDEAQMSEYIALIKDRLGITDEEFKEIMTSSGKQHTEYRTDELYSAVINILKRYEIL